jgi:hypothetical protein
MVDVLRVRDLQDLLDQLPEGMDEFVVLVGADSGFAPLSRLQVGWCRDTQGTPFIGASPEAGENWMDASRRATLEYAEAGNGPDAEPAPFDQHDHRAVCLLP